MIDLYYWTTPNGHKITMFLEEPGSNYRSFRSISARATSSSRSSWRSRRTTASRRSSIMTARWRRTRSRIFESGAILLYLAEKTGRFCPRICDGRRRDAMAVLADGRVSGRWPGQNHHFAIYAPEKIPYAIDRYVNETNRLYGVLNKRLA